MKFVTTILGILLDAAKQLLTWKEAWFVLGPVLVGFALVFYFKVIRRKTDEDDENGKPVRFHMPVFSFKTKTLSFLTIAILGAGVYAYNEFATARTKVQFVRVSSAQNGSKTVSENRVQIGVDIVLARGKRFELCNAGGKYSAEALLDGATPLVRVIRTSDNTTIGGGFIHSPFDETQNAESLCEEIGGIISRTISSFEGTPTNEESGPTPQLPISKKVAEPKAEATKADDGVFHPKPLKKAGK